MTDRYNFDSEGTPYYDDKGSYVHWDDYASLQQENERLKELFGLSEPWPLIDIVNLLTKGTARFLQEYDGPDHEELYSALVKGSEFANALSSWQKKGDRNG